MITVVVGSAGCGGDASSGSLPAGVAYTLDRGGLIELWLLPTNGTRPLAEVDPIRIDAPAGEPGRLAISPDRFSRDRGVAPSARWSPDGGQLAALLTVDGALTLHAIAAGGGATTMLAANARELPYESAWDPAGQRVLFLDEALRLWVATASGSDATLLSTGDVVTPLTENWSRFDVSWSPDGRAVAFQEETLEEPIGHVVTLDGVDVVADVVTPLRSFWIGWMPSGAGVYVLTGGQAGIVCLATGAFVPFPGDAANGRGDGYWSPDGRRLVVMTFTEATLFDVSGCDLTERGRVPLTDGSQLGGRAEHMWTDDANHLAFVEYGSSGGSSLQVIDLEPLAPPRVLSSSGVGVTWGPLPVGSRMAWVEGSFGAAGRMMISDTAARGATVLAESASGFVPAPDDRQLAFVGSAPEAAFALQVMALDSGLSPQVIYPAGLLPRWSPRADGLAFASVEGASVSLHVAMNTGDGFGTPHRLDLGAPPAGSRDPIRWFAWSP